MCREAANVEPSGDRVSASRYLLFLAIAAAGCGLDLWSKRQIFQWRGMPQTSDIWWLWEGYVGIETSLNTGALGGMGEGKVLYLAVFSFVALVGILYWFVFARAGRDLMLTITLACITGGILGNLYDRLGLWSATGQRAVRDWIRFSYNYDDFIWPNFNVADSLLVCGAGLLVWHSFAARKHPSAKKDQPEPKVVQK